MSTKVKINIDSTEKILLKRGLDKNGKAQKFMTHEIRRLSDKYVPYRNGPLKNTAIEKVDQIQYIQPYARYLWYGKVMVGKPKKATAKNLKYYNGKLRGRFWVTRMWSDRGKEIVDSVAKFAGGKPG